ncbi:MAG: ADP-dependent NAD(P)H-hydrate dehydratase / NAD(P)H-hydrate epimerase [Acidobacteriota bacterium]|nr:ADP-dependent NAD(P)H-hydrate dehydratase / NAD(P)H-hydrate epimerase [Acidobacteriota bacterium]
MLKVLSAAAMREVDRLTTERFSTPAHVLMEEAAASALRAIAAEFQDGLQGKHVRVLCGPGNNGGDGAALARKLWLSGARADVVLFGRAEETRNAARTNFQIAQRLSDFDAGTHTQPPPLGFVECITVADWEDLASSRHSYDVIVDALFGTGLKRPLEGIYAKGVEHLALLRRARERSHSETPLIVSLDIPSGLDSDSANPIGEAVWADLTVTFTAPKAANVLAPAAYSCGKLVVANIGSPAALLEATDSKLFLTEEAEVHDWLVKTRYRPGSFKNQHGHVLIIGGSREMTGATALSGKAAMRSGAGLVTIATSISAQPTLAARSIPEIMTASLPETSSGAVGFEGVADAVDLMTRATVLAIGPGLTHDDESTRRFVRAVIEQRTTPVVIDADALNALAPWVDLRGSQELPLILTPHPGEMLRLMGTDDKAALNERVRIAGEFASKHHLILVLKGARTVVASPQGRVFINPTGNAGLGTAGAGDTLTGLIAGFLAQAYATLKGDADALAATIAAVYVGGLAGDIAAGSRGMRSLTASEISDEFGSAICRIDPIGERP